MVASEVVPRRDGFEKSLETFVVKKCRPVAMNLNEPVNVGGKTF